jgi:hypothetical protein
MIQTAAGHCRLGRNRKDVLDRVDICIDELHAAMHLGENH